MKNKLIYENIGYVLLERFPELQERAGKEDLEAEAPLAYPLFEIFFKEFFLSSWRQVETILYSVGFFPSWRKCPTRQIAT
jgi:hypothetical protein